MLIPQALEPLGKVLRIDQSNTLIPNTDVRILISLKPGVDLPESSQFYIDPTLVCCPITFLCGLGGCFVCRKEGNKKQPSKIVYRQLPSGLYYHKKRGYKDLFATYDNR